MDLPEWPPGTVAILATGAGHVHAIPISTGLRAGPRRVLFGLSARRESLRRLRAEPRVALVILCEGDVAITAYGTAEIVEEPLRGCDRMVAVALAVDELADHGQPDSEVEAGVRWRWIDPIAQQRDAQVRAALQRLAASQDSAPPGGTKVPEA
ncbi:MAG: hypothetical protein ACRD0K_05050 [Egibacteraceae bacterium]